MVAALFSPRLVSGWLLFRYYVYRDEIGDMCTNMYKLSDFVATNWLCTWRAPHFCCEVVQNEPGEGFRGSTQQGSTKCRALKDFDFRDAPPTFIMSWLFVEARESEPQGCNTTPAFSQLLESSMIISSNSIELQNPLTCSVPILSCSKS